MSVRQIVFSNEPILHHSSERVHRVDKEVRQLVEDMIESMRAAQGIGLAAVQVGVPQRVIVVEIPASPEDEEEPAETADRELHILINPEIVSTSGEVVEGLEGCLSIPGWVGEVERPHAVVLEGLDLEGRQVRIEAEGLLARVFQHEVDHCEGILFIDHIEDPEKIWRVEEGQEETIEATQEIPA
ncbi:MAG: peptide deformylase [Chloroflexota bacterium]